MWMVMLKYRDGWFKEIQVDIHVIERGYIYLPELLPCKVVPHTELDMPIESIMHEYLFRDTGKVTWRGAKIYEYQEQEDGIMTRLLWEYGLMEYFPEPYFLPFSSTKNLSFHEIFRY